MRVELGFSILSAISCSPINAVCKFLYLQYFDKVSIKSHKGNRNLVLLSFCPALNQFNVIDTTCCTEIFPLLADSRKNTSFHLLFSNSSPQQLPQWPGPVCPSPPSCQSLAFTCIHTVAFSGEKWECFAMLHDQSVEHASFKIHVEVSEQNFKTSSPRCRQRRG